MSAYTISTNNDQWSTSIDSNCAGEKINIMVWITDASWSADIYKSCSNFLWQCIGYGEGGGGATDCTWRSFSANEDEERGTCMYIATPGTSTITSTVFGPRSVKLEGTGTVGSIRACVEPVVCIGDSYAAGYVGDEMILQGYASRISDKFDEEREVIHSAINGNSMYSGDGSKHSIAARIGLVPRFGDNVTPDLYPRRYSALGFQDTCEFVNCIYILANGPSINDMDLIILHEAPYTETNTTEQIVPYAIARIGELIDYSTGDLSIDTGLNISGYNCHIVLGEMVWEPRIANQKDVIHEAIRQWNYGLRWLANMDTSGRVYFSPIKEISSESVTGDNLGITYYGGFLDGYRSDYASKHPSGDGYVKLAQMLVDAFENDQTTGFDVITIGWTME